MLSVARGKVSEGAKNLCAEFQVINEVPKIGVDFDHNYGRAVILFGIPYQVSG